MRARREDGTTLIEVIAVIALAGILMATAAWTFVAYLNSSREKSTAVEVRAALRNVSERALSEGRTYCIYFNASTNVYGTYRSDCTVAGNRVALGATDAPNIGLSAVTFTPPTPAIPNQYTACPQPNACAYVYPRGNAIAGSVRITRTGTSKAYVVTVEGLTSRVSLA